ncbi:MAG: DUF488 domain-containing protein [Actinobacteria bacterium]|nr:DUF488 domain-containing protein [Actinomycetota bacterium]
MATLWTIGHSTHTLDEFIALLRNAGMQRVADVRSVPRSRRVPWFNKESLVDSLPAAGIAYIHTKNLGGWRKPRPDSINTGWRNAGFRGYADYMQSEEFTLAAAELAELAKKKPTAVMCAEAVPFRCHRSLIADFFTARGYEVLHIFPDGRMELHVMTPFAVVRQGKITYPL